MDNEINIAYEGNILQPCHSALHMPQLCQRQRFPYSCRQLFDLVADVERYPEFLPWCVAARIVERGDGYFIADLVVRFKHITESYRSHVRLMAPEAPQSEARVDVSQVSGPFRHLENHWLFSPAPKGACELVFELDFSFKTPLLDGLIGGLFSRANEKMIDAFSQRAAALYGQNTLR